MKEVTRRTVPTETDFWNEIENRAFSPIKVDRSVRANSTPHSKPLLSETTRKRAHRRQRPRPRDEREGEERERERALPHLVLLSLLREEEARGERAEEKGGEREKTVSEVEEKQEESPAGALGKKRG